jgi:hypothetical protein
MVADLLLHFLVCATVISPRLEKILGEAISWVKKEKRWAPKSKDPL